MAVRKGAGGGGWRSGRVSWRRVAILKGPMSSLLVLSSSLTDRRGGRLRPEPSGSASAVGSKPSACGSVLPASSSDVMSSPTDRRALIDARLSPSGWVRPESEDRSLWRRCGTLWSGLVSGSGPLRRCASSSSGAGAGKRERGRASGAVSSGETSVFLRRKGPAAGRDAPGSCSNRPSSRGSVFFPSPMTSESTSKRRSALSPRARRAFPGDQTLGRIGPRGSAGP